MRESIGRDRRPCRSLCSKRQCDDPFYLGCSLREIFPRETIDSAQWPAETPAATASLRFKRPLF
jgi:hypothetical protein